MELWFIFFVLLVAGLGVFAMFGYVRNETDKMELKHLLATEQFKRQIMELESERDSAVKRSESTVEEMTKQVEEMTKQAEELREANDKLQASLDALRRSGSSRDVGSDLPRISAV